MWGKKELSHLVLHRGDGFSEEALVVPLELVLPEQLQARIGDTLYDAAPVVTVRKNPRHTEQRNVLALQERRNRCVQQVLKPRSPGVAPDGLEGSSHT